MVMAMMKMMTISDDVRRTVHIRGRRKHQLMPLMTDARATTDHVLASHKPPRHAIPRRHGRTQLPLTTWDE